MKAPFKIDDLGLPNPESVIPQAAADAQCFVDSLNSGFKTDKATALFGQMARFYACKGAGTITEHPEVQAEAEAALESFKAGLKKPASEPARKPGFKKQQAALQQAPAETNPEGQED